MVVVRNSAVTRQQDLTQIKVTKEVKKKTIRKRDTRLVETWKKGKALVVYVLSNSGSASCVKSLLVVDLSHYLMNKFQLIVKDLWGLTSSTRFTTAIQLQAHPDQPHCAAES